MENDVFAVGVGLVLPSHGEQHVQRGSVAVIEIVLHSVVQIEDEGGTALVGIGKGQGRGAVRATAVVPLDAVGGHLVPRDFVFDPYARFLHPVKGNDGVPRV